jgi:FkbM family methyltransferase
MLKRWFVTAASGTMRYWVTLVVVVSRLGAGRRMRLKMLSLGLLLPLRDRFFGPRDVRLRLRYGRFEVAWWVGPKSDFDVLNEVLVLKVYDRAPLSREPRTILDLGSHIGASVLFWREKFPDARIVAVEPDPASFRRLARNVESLPAVELRNLAVSDVEGTSVFYSAQQAWISSLSEAGRPVLVQSYTLSSLVSELADVDLLKIDIEGAEHRILRDLGLEGIGAIIGEYHYSGEEEQRQRFFSHLAQFYELTVGPQAAFMPFHGYRRN